MQRGKPGRSTAWASLQRRWFVFAGFCLLFLGGGYLSLSAAWVAGYAVRWLVLPSLAIIYLLAVLYRNLGSNRRSGETDLLPTLGWGNHLTLLRGVLVAGMAGFLFLPWPPGWLAWVPGLFYILSDIADFSDGLVARLTRHATPLGEILDMSFDGLGVMVAALLAVQYGQVPAWYALVAFARYLFLIGLWIRRRLGKPIHEMTPSISRRIFAGLQMGFLGAILLPVFSPPGTHIAAALFGLPLLAGFAWDWLVVSGVLRPAQKNRNDLREATLRWLPAFLRLLILVMTLAWLAQGVQTPSTPGPAFNLAYGLTVLLVVFGFLPRLFSIAGLCLLGVYQMYAGLTGLQIVSAAAYTVILYMGSGVYSAWTPEDYLFRRRVGESDLEAQG